MQHFTQAKKVCFGPFAILIVKGERKNGGDNHFCHKHNNHEDEVFVERSLQCGEFILGYLGVEGELGLSSCVHTACKHFSCVF